MSGSVNKVILVGNLGRDPETRTFQSGGKMTSLRVATSEAWKDRETGERKERTEWHQVSIFGALADVAEKYLRKGSKVYLEGSLQTRKWQDQAGNDRYTTEVVIRGPGCVLQLLDRKVDGDAGEGPEAGSGSGYYDKARSNVPYSGDPDDDIPF